MAYVLAPADAQPFFPLSITDPTKALKGFKKDHGPNADVHPVTRYFCSTCGTHLFNLPVGSGTVIVLPYVWDTESESSPAVVYQPVLHACFKDHALNPNDDKPKFPSFPPQQ